MSPRRPYPGHMLRRSMPPMVSHDVLAVQLRLAALGLVCADLAGYEVPRVAGAPRADIAGVFGPRTEAKVRSFQERNDLDVDGIVGPLTWSALFAPQDAVTRLLPRRAGDGNRRDTDLAKLHPVLRERFVELQERLRARDVPMKLFEGFRSPERQAALFAKGRDATGRISSRREVVTYAQPFQSYHQYGVAIDMVIDRPGVGMWEDGTPEAQGWWTAYHEVAASLDLEWLSFEKPHVQMAGLSSSRLLAGDYPPGGDDSWAANLAEAIVRWSGSPKPPAPLLADRPPLVTAVVQAVGESEAAIDWRDLPRVEPTDWQTGYGRQHWRVDDQGVYLRGGTANSPLRTPGNPVTCAAVVETFGPAIAAAAAKHGVPPEVLIMTIATEAALYRSHGFTGPRTFRWEAHVTDYSAGPMQVLSSTAREVNRAARLGYSDDIFPHMTTRPQTPPDDLSLYQGDVALDVGAGYLRQQMDRYRTTDPILLAAAYNAGSIRASTANPWGLRCHNDHLDRAAKWFGDACAVLQMAGR